ncbi:MAG: HD domain-containing protein [Pseudomonadota bacterium]|nr:HD domain-containing protein [Pseudomonadota bacterium]
MVEIDQSLIEYSRAYAEKAHGSQTYGDLPYIMHLDAVARYVESYGINATIIAYLHDVVEDTPVTNKMIYQEFGGFIADCVSIVTDEPGLNRQEKKSKTYAKMSQVQGELELALVIKAADRLVNMQASLSNNHARLIETYTKEYPIFKQSVFREKLCQELWNELDLLADKCRAYSFNKPI